MESAMMATLPIVQYQPSPPANLVGPLLDLCWNSPPIPLPSKIIILIIANTNQKPHNIHCSIPRAPQAPHTFHVAEPITQHTIYAPEVMSSGHHMVFRGFESASFGKHWSMILSVTFPYYYHMLYSLTPFMFMILFI